jgi:hypothetical protein
VDVALKIRRCLAILPLALAALSLPACGGEELQSLAPRESVAQAATKTSNAASSRFAFTAAVSGKGLLEGAEWHFSGEGVFDHERQRGRMRYDMSDAFPAAKEPIDVVVDGLVLYMNFPRELSALPPGKGWLKLDVESIGRIAGLDKGELTTLNVGDPSQMLRYLRGAGTAVSRVGSAELRGVATTHYRVTIDLEKALAESIEDVPEKNREAVRVSMERMAKFVGEEVPVDVWIDSDHLARKMKIDYEITWPGQDKLHTDLTMEFFDFGIDADVELPPSAEVLDYEEMIEGG